VEDMREKTMFIFIPSDLDL